MRRVLPEREDRVESAEVELLRQQILELQRRATMAEVELERMRRQVAELQAGEHETSLPPGPGSVDTEPHAAEQSRADVTKPVIIEVPALEVADLEPAGDVSIGDRTLDPPDERVLGALTSDGEVADTEAVAAAVSEEGQALYDRGYTAFHQGQYVEAETTFQQFLAEFRHTDLGDNAQFWIGEARYAREDLSGAMAAFREVVSRYPKGNKVPDALLKIGDCQHGLGDIEGARKSYQSIADRYPMAAAAAVAEDRLQELP
jgi:tol-pal system protein YbgF